MSYEIQRKEDSLSGTVLTVQIPERDVDRKALYTLQYETPEFLVPFRYRDVDGQVELAYQLGERSKLRYFYGAKTPEEYIRLWEGLLRPLLDCGEWFLKPLSFVLEPEYLYQDKQGRISYLYIPSRPDFSSRDQLKNMAMQVADKNSVSSPELENMIFRMLMKDFQPRTFLEALHKTQTPAMPAPVDALYPPPPPLPAVKQEKQETVPPPKAPLPAPVPVRDGDIFIDFPGKAKEKKKGGFSLFGGKGEKAVRKKGKEKKDLEQKTSPVGKPSGISKGEPGKKPWPDLPVYVPPAAVRPSPAAAETQLKKPNAVYPAAEENETQLEEFGTCLRLVGAAGLPPVIPVQIEVGEVFTIGRYDTSVGRQQSSFEFREDTKAVSRRHHAAIERDADGYTITDMASRAGTFVDGRPLQPNLPYRLRRNVKISFGTGGADYLWEE
ncbi:FHA domain-containing protein [Clostridium sp. D33t1_170424_F3]|uniref:FHA domain-containing protein n=1 Tax=Clostridium sp. D33t1_170424_F3 TaxID=2787099 RepID=UPI0018AAB22C|nr:FHA domain-containing protein [Clostridium sp. D33t1_170424_F3]